MTDIAAAIRKRIAEIEAELAAHPLQHERAALERALADLGADDKGKRRATNSARRSGATRAPRGERRKQVLTHLEREPGSRPSEIAKTIGASPNQVHGILAKLRKDKLVKKQGKGYSVTKAAGGATDGADSSRRPARR